MLLGRSAVGGRRSAVGVAASATAISRAERSVGGFRTVTNCDARQTQVWIETGRGRAGVAMHGGAARDAAGVERGWCAGWGGGRGGGVGEARSRARRVCRPPPPAAPAPPPPCTLPPGSHFSSGVPRWPGGGAAAGARARALRLEAALPRLLGGRPRWRSSLDRRARLAALRYSCTIVSTCMHGHVRITVLGFGVCPHLP